MLFHYVSLCYGTVYYSVLPEDDAWHRELLAQFNYFVVFKQRTESKKIRGLHFFMQRYHYNMLGGGCLTGVMSTMFTVIDTTVEKSLCPVLNHRAKQPSVWGKISTGVPAQSSHNIY